jgi:hypothetical protein
MIRVKFASLLALLIAVLAALCMPTRADASCTAATIENTYGIHADGFAVPTANTALKVSAFFPAAAIGEASFIATSDTGGTVSGAEKLSFGGVQLQFTFTGTYTVSAPTCSGRITTADQDTIDFVIVKGGEKIEILETRSGAVFQGAMEKED